MVVICIWNLERKSWYDVDIVVQGCVGWWERPYQHDSTASRPLSEVKHVRAWLVLRWGTTLESQVLFSFPLLFSFSTPTPFFLYPAKRLQPLLLMLLLFSIYYIPSAICFTTTQSILYVQLIQSNIPILFLHSIHLHKTYFCYFL